MLTLEMRRNNSTLVAAFQRFYGIERTDYANDYSGTAANAATYAILELNFAIIATSLPMLLPVFRKVRDATLLKPCKRSKEGGSSESSRSERFTDSFDRKPTMPPWPSSSLTADRKGSSDRPLHIREMLRTPSPAAVHEDYPFSGLEPQLPLPVLARRSRLERNFYAHESLGH